MKKFIIGIALVSASLLTVESACAAGGTTPGFFLGINGGYSRTNVTLSDLLSESEATGASFKNARFAYGIVTGTMFNQYIGFQLSMNQYQSAKASKDNNYEELRPYNASLSLLLSCPIYRGFAVYGQAGMGGTLLLRDYKDENDDDIAISVSVQPQFGGGLEYTFNKHVTISAGYNWTRMARPDDNLPEPKKFNIHYYHGGLTYTF